MKLKIINTAIVILLFSMQGCATVKGVKTDVKNLWSKITGGGGAKGTVEKTDSWIKEHMW